MIEVLASGPLTTVQDAGRVGFAGLGVPRSGAFDRAAFRLANRLVGNIEAAPALELTAGGLEFLARDAVTVALTGAPCPGLDWGQPITLPAGATVRLGGASAGLRSYLAVRGGVDVDPVLRSRSTDLLSGIGPAPLRPGDRIAIGIAVGGDVPGATELAPPSPASAHLVRVVLGPRADWFAADATDALTATPWTVRSDSNRVGIRLEAIAARARSLLGGEL